MSLIEVVLGSVHPGRGGPAVGLLAALIERAGQEVSVAEAARAGGISWAMAARTATRLVQVGLVTERRMVRDRLLSINVSSPLYPPICSLLWIAQGVTSLAASAPAGENPPFQINDREVQKLVPDELQTPGCTLELPREVHDGPEVTRARALVPHLNEAVSRTRLTPMLQQTYGRWHDERDRDLLYLTTHLGCGAAQAARVLRAASTQAAASTQVIGRLAWAHATYAVNAEAQLCLDVSTRLTETVDQVRNLGRHKQPTQLGAATGEESRSHLAEELAAEEACLAAVVTQPIAGHDAEVSTSPMNSVGSAGERLIAVIGRQAAVEMAFLAHEMAAHPSFVKWRTTNPNIAARHPLLPVPARDLEPQVSSTAPEETAK